MGYKEKKSPHNYSPFLSFSISALVPFQTNSFSLFLCKNNDYKYSNISTFANEKFEPQKSKQHFHMKFEC